MFENRIYYLSNREFMKIWKYEYNLCKGELKDTSAILEFEEMIELKLHDIENKYDFSMN